MMKVVSKALERESSFEKLTDARAAKQENAADEIVLLCGSDQLVRGIVQFGWWHIGELVFFVQPSACRGHSDRNRMSTPGTVAISSIFDAIGGFNLHRADDVVVQSPA